MQEIRVQKLKKQLQGCEEMLSSQNVQFKKYEERTADLKLTVRQLMKQQSEFEYLKGGDLMMLIGEVDTE